MEDGRVPLFGREAERDRLVEAIAADRSIAVLGEAGIGKTTLVRNAAAASGRPLHEGGGFATLQDAPLLALRRAVGDGLDGDDATVAGLVERRVGPDLLFLDDLQWIDRASAAVLRLLRGRLGLIVAIRSGDAGFDAAVALANDLGLDELRLSGLGAGAARMIVAQAKPGLGSTDLEQIVARAGGNPLLLEELATRGEPSLVLARSIQAGLDGLSEAGRDVLQLLAVVGRPVDAPLFGDASDEPRRAGLLLERDGQLEIRHALIAEAIRGELDATTRRALHERAARLVSDPVETARHQSLAGLPALAAVTATQALASTLDPNARAQLLVLMAEAAEPPGDATARLAAAGALTAVSDWPEVVRVLEAEDPAGSLDEGGSRSAFLTHALFSLGRLDEARAVLDRADRIDLEPGTPASGQLAIERAAFMVNVDGRIHPAIDFLSGVLATHPVDQPTHHAIRSIIESLRMLAAQPVDIDYLRGSVDGAIAAGQFVTAADLARVVNFALVIWHGPEAAVTFVDAIADRLADAGALGAATECRVETIQATLLAGRPAEAVERADALLELPASMRARQTATIFRARSLGTMGLLEPAALSLAELESTVTSDFVGRGWLLWAQADLALWGGVVARAIERADRVLGVASPVVGAFTAPELTRAWAQLDMGLAPSPLSGPLDAPTQAGAPHEMAGLTRLHAGDARDAAARFADAARLWAGQDQLRSLWCRWAEGETLRRADDDAAIPRLETTLEDAVASRFEVVAVRVRRSLRLAGRRLPAERRPAVEGLGLTHREREIVELAGQGLTNAEIARRMGVGRPTVARILSNAMAKLGVGSRAQAISLVATGDAPGTRGSRAW